MSAYGLRLTAYCFLLTAYGLLLTSCNKSDEFVYTDESEEGKTTVTVTDEQGGSKLLAPGMSVGVYVVDSDGTLTCQQVVVGESGSIALPTSASASRMVVYAPYQAEWGEDALTTDPVFSVESDQSTAANYESSDLMIGLLSTANSLQSVPSVAMRHVMSKVAIHIIDETGRISFSDCTAELLNVSTNVQVHLSEASVTTVSEPRGNVQMLSESTTDWRISFYAIVAPQSISEGAEILKLNIGGSIQYFTMPQSAELESGKTYTLNIRLTNEGLIPLESYVTDWYYEDENSLTV